MNIFKFLMACDPVAEVRRQIVSLIALTSHTLPGKIEGGFPEHYVIDSGQIIRRSSVVLGT